jgi:hypothetical protein
MVDAGDRELSREECLLLEEHAAQCAACSGLKEFWGNIRADIKKAPKAGLPESLESRVRSLCHAEIGAAQAGRSRQDLSSEAVPVPRPIWAALAVLTALTLTLLVGGIEEFSRSKEVTVEIVLLAALILQNGLTLFFAPVIMRRRGLGDMGIGWIK